MLDTEGGFDRSEAAVVSLLLIEDDPGDALLVEEMASDAVIDFGIVWARSLDEARTRLGTTLPDCIVLDLNLPDAHGLDALEAVQRYASGVPVIVMTGLAEEQAGLTAVAEGAQDYLVKGVVDAELLTRSVRYAIERKRAEHAAAALQASEQRSRENARLERGLLPVPLLRSDSIDVVTRYRTGRAGGLLGGDFYDVVETGDGAVHVLIGDVCGHGADEAALGVGLRMGWRTMVLGGVDAETKMNTLEQLLVAERPRSHIFATATSVVLSADHRSIEVVRAGHPGILLRTPGDIQWLEVPGGPALGLRKQSGTWQKTTLAIEERTALVLFTDGLFEARVDELDRLGEDGLLAYARSLGSACSGEKFVDSLITHVESLAAPHGGLSDDVAVLHVQWADENGRS
ncbi:PP2C family protein-serine/threonine phosphatase [Rhodococcus zopfii]|uniref:PP2C family protein-serine/threonine phosphatase n=1 Tax=Rhodococcus zopfii TaxID=43772 RepID=UPI001F0E7470|nr:fused response regulator/phosphatase [Rhodococcus zopfii]